MMLPDLIKEFQWSMPFIRNLVYRTPKLYEEHGSWISESRFSFSETFAIKIAKELQDCGLRNMLNSQVVEILLQIKDWTFLLEQGGYIDEKKYFIVISKVLPRVRHILERSLIGSAYNITEKGEQQMLPGNAAIGDRMVFIGEIPFIYQTPSIYLRLFSNLIDVKDKWQKYQ